MSHHATAQRPDSAVAVWIAAIRPATLWAGAVPVFVGTALALAGGARAWLPAAAALLGALLIQIGCNLVNDYADFHKGADTADRLGPVRATAKGWLTPRQVAAGAALALAGGALTGVYLTWVGGWPILALGLASLAAAVAYTAGPFPLGYHGLGDLFVLLFFGFGATVGTAWVVGGAAPAAAWWAGAGVGALATAILVVNNLRDRAGDAKAGKRTLAVRFGPTFARAEYTALVAFAYAVPVGLVAAGAPWGGLLPLASLPLAVKAVRALWITDGAALNPWLGATARLELLYGLLFSAGVLL
ncbi:MAG: 1,4-dihydroxy-2-naphthoate polyprenyltransferase [Myxococcales bacterium]|nr:1,4-dihydroxy-2-naphthoate polyprenyltransferase [Myxococcales bacterium]